MYKKDASWPGCSLGAPIVAGSAVAFSLLMLCASTCIPSILGAVVGAVSAVALFDEIPQIDTKSVLLGRGISFWATLATATLVCGLLLFRKEGTFLVFILSAIIAALCFTRGLSFAFASSNGGHSSLPQIASIVAFACVCGLAVLFECWRRGYFHDLLSGNSTGNVGSRHSRAPPTRPPPPPPPYPPPPHSSPPRPRRPRTPYEGSGRRGERSGRRRDRRDDIESRRRHFREESYFSDEE